LQKYCEELVKPFANFLNGGRLAIASLRIVSVDDQPKQA